MTTFYFIFQCIVATSVLGCRPLMCDQHPICNCDAGSGINMISTNNSNTNRSGRGNTDQKTRKYKSRFDLDGLMSSVDVNLEDIPRTFSGLSRRCNECYYGIKKALLSYDELVAYCAETGGSPASFNSEIKYKVAVDYCRQWILDNDPISGYYTFWTDMRVDSKNDSIMLRNGTTGYGNWQKSAYEEDIPVFSQGGEIRFLPISLAVNKRKDGTNTGLQVLPSYNALYPLCERWD